MRFTGFILISAFIISCEQTGKRAGSIPDPEEERQDTLAFPVNEREFITEPLRKNKVNNSKNWQAGFGLSHDPDKDSIWNKPVSYYLSNKECSGLAADFYYGLLRPSDNGTTDELLKLATTNNKDLRPFYRWCLNKTIEIQDGALGEHTGIPARRYAEKFPKEFFEYMDIDSSGFKYNVWVDAIKYSGFYEGDNFDKPSEVRAKMAESMKKNCIDCNASMPGRIEKLALDCFGKRLN